MNSNFTLFLLAMTAVAVVVFIALYFVKAGYGMLRDGRWGKQINNKLGWVLMESPVFIAMAILWGLSAEKSNITLLVFFLIFEFHYFQRSFIYPMLIKGKSTMPLGIIVMGVVFNLLNALMQGGWLFYLAPADYYTVEWLYSPQFIIGTAMFLGGMAINIHSDHIIRSLRKPGDTGHYIPRGGMFRYVSSANYLGEIIEWTGFAVLTWSASGLVFAVWTFANLVPRANAIYTRYEQMFGEEFTKLKLKRIIPFIY